MEQNVMGDEYDLSVLSLSIKLKMNELINIPKYSWYVKTIIFSCIQCFFLVYNYGNEVIALK